MYLNNRALWLRCISYSKIWISIPFLALLVSLYYFRSDFVPIPLSSLALQSSSHHNQLPQLCSSTPWTSGLWIRCHGNGRPDSFNHKTFLGGLSNGHSKLQSCIRLAIDAGAGVVLPNFHRRNPENIQDVGGGAVVPLSRYWGMACLINSLVG